MPSFIKTSKGFINVDQITFISPPDKKGEIYIDTFGNEDRYWLGGEEAARIVSEFNLLAWLDTTKSPGEAPS
jgi:hypothetical protein